MIKDYYDFVDEYVLFQRDKPLGIGVIKCLILKNEILRKHQLAGAYLWKVPLEILNEILKECERSKK